MPRFNVNRKSEFEPSKKSDDSLKQIEGFIWTQDSADSDREITKEHLDRCTADHEKKS